MKTTKDMEDKTPDCFLPAEITQAKTNKASTDAPHSVKIKDLMDKGKNPKASISAKDILNNPKIEKKPLVHVLQINENDIKHITRTKEADDILRQIRARLPAFKKKHKTWEAAAAALSIQDGYLYNIRKGKVKCMGKKFKEILNKLSANAE